MSTQNPTHIIAEHLHADTFTARNRVTKERAVVTRCLCGDTVPAEDFAAHVVSKLTDAGYSIVEPAEGDPDTSALDEARSWARHGYEIGQRSATWVDHGVAPKWLTRNAAAAAEGEKP